MQAPKRPLPGTPPLTVVVGLGEVGRPLQEVLGRVHRVEGVDLAPRHIQAPVDFLHVCYPAEIDDFVGVTADYVRRYEPEIVVIHSTVAIGTTRAVAQVVTASVVHSPVRGKHARMVEELAHYVKFIGTVEPAVGQRAAEHFEAAGIKARVFGSPETTELAKLTETTYFGLLIAYAQDVARMAQAVGVPYDDVASFWDEIAYLPMVRFFPGVIGGHCVMPNIRLLKRAFRSELLDAIEWSNELRQRA